MDSFLSALQDNVPMLVGGVALIVGMLIGRALAARYLNLVTWLISLALILCTFVFYRQIGEIARTIFDTLGIHGAAEFFVGFAIPSCIGGIALAFMVGDAGKKQDTPPTS